MEHTGSFTSTVFGASSASETLAISNANRIVFILRTILSDMILADEEGSDPGASGGLAGPRGDYLYQGCRADPLCALRTVPSAERHRAHVAARLQLRPPFGPVDPRSGQDG